MTIYSKQNPPSGFYIYFWIRHKSSATAEAGTPYYVGKGSGRRAWNHGGPIDQKNIIIAEANLLEIGALALERRYIKWYGRKDLSTGILINLTDGGEGTAGAVYGSYSDERKQNISKSRKEGYSTGKIVSWNKGLVGAVPWNKGKKLSDEQKANMGPPKGRVPWNKGKKGVQISRNAGKKLGPAHNKGKPSGKKGMTYEEIYGPEKAAELKERRRIKKQEYWSIKGRRLVE